MIELTLRDPDFTDLRELALEEFIGKVAAFLEAFGVHGPTLDGVVLDDLTRPFSELNGTFIFDLEAYGNDGLEVVVVHGALDLSFSFHLNY